jgi:hypothetical protein
MASNSLHSPPTGSESSLALAIEESDTSEQAARHCGLYAYGVIGEHSLQCEMPGIDKRHSVYPVNGKDMAVMVSKIDIATFQKQVKNLFAELTTAPGHGATLLQAHEAVVDALLQVTTVVPFKFGTILKDEKAALKMLRDDAERFQKLLAKFSGRVEWGLKVYADTQAWITYSAQSGPPLNSQVRAPLLRGTAYLLGKKMEAELRDCALARLSEVTESIFEELGKDAHEARVNKTLPQKFTGKKKEMVLNTVYLLEQEKVANFCKQGKKLKEKYASVGLDLEISGPWPPYNFT